MMAHAAASCLLQRRAALWRVSIFERDFNEGQDLTSALSTGVDDSFGLQLLGVCMSFIALDSHTTYVHVWIPELPIPSAELKQRPQQMGWAPDMTCQLGWCIATSWNLCQPDCTHASAGGSALKQM